MQDVTLDALRRDVEALARECSGLRRRHRLWNRGAGLALMVGIVLVAGGAFRSDGPRTIEAERFVIKGRDGVARAELVLAADPASKAESVELVLRDGAGKSRAVLSVGTDGTPVFSMRDGGERTRLAIASSPEGSTLVHFYEKAGWGQMSLGAWPNASGLKLWGPDKEGRGGSDHGGLMVTSDGSTKLNFFTPGPVRKDRDFERVSVGVSPAGKPSLTITGDDGRPTFHAPAP